MESLTADLDLARNGAGRPLHRITKVDLALLAEQPNPERWARAANAVIAVGPAGEPITLATAVARIAPRAVNGNGTAPDAVTVRAAIRWAVRGELPPATNPLRTVPGAPRPAAAAARADAPVSPAYATPESDPWSEIDLDSERKRELRKWLAMFEAQHPAAPRGLLLFGPPGTGKTLLARVLAKASGAAFLPVTVSDLKAPNVGGTAQRVRDLWERARNAAKSIIFIDECEGIFGAREGVESDSFNRELLQEFLAQWEGVLDNSRHVWVIGATNRRERVDVAMVSRFGAEFSFALPDAALRRRILARELRRCRLEIDFAERVVTQTNGFSGRDLRTLAESVARESFDPDTGRCAPTRAQFRHHVATIRKRGNIGVSKRSTWANLILSPEIKSELQIVCEMLRRSEEMRAHGIALPRGLLLYGPSGTGKTEIARTLANESGLNFVAAKSTDFVGGYSGWSGQMTRAVFNRARAESPAILFIDELDKIAPRAELGSGSGSFTIEVVRSLIEEIDGVAETEGHVFVVAATNRIELVDDALASRLGKALEIPLPDREQRAALALSRLHGVRLDTDAVTAAERLADATSGFSGRDVVLAIERAQQRGVARMLLGERKELILTLADLLAQAGA